MAVQKMLLSVCRGAFLEAILFLSLLPVQPSPMLRNIVAYTQAPGDSMLRLVGHFFPLGPTTVPIVFTVVFLVQTVFLGLPIWILLKLIRNGSARSA